MKIIEDMEIRLSENTILSKSCRMTVVINSDDIYMLTSPTEYSNIDDLVYEIIKLNGAVLSKMAQSYSHLDLSSVSAGDLMIHATTYATAIATSINAEFEAMGIRDIHLSPGVEVNIAAIYHQPDRGDSSFSAHCVVIEDDNAIGELDVDFQFDGSHVILTKKSKAEIKGIIKKSQSMRDGLRHRRPLTNEMFSSGQHDSFSIIVRRIKNDVGNLVFN